MRNEQFKWRRQSLLSSTSELRLLLDEYSKCNEYEVQKIVRKIFDKRMKGYLNLESKQEIIQKSQNLLIRKTLDYMNIINEMQTKHLKSLSRLNDMIDNKLQIIEQKQSRILELQEQMGKINKEVFEYKKQIMRLTEQYQQMQQKWTKIGKQNEVRMLKRQKQLIDQNRTQFNKWNQDINKIKSYYQNSISQLNCKLQSNLIKLKQLNQIIDIKNNDIKQLQYYYQHQLSILQTNHFNHTQIIHQLSSTNQNLTQKTNAIRQYIYQHNQIQPLVPIAIKPKYTSYDSASIQTQRLTKQFLATQLAILQFQQYQSNQVYQAQQILDQVINQQVKQVSYVKRVSINSSNRSIVQAKSSSKIQKSRTYIQNMAQNYKRDYEQKLILQKKFIREKMCILVDEMRDKNKEYINTCNKYIRIWQQKYAQIQNLYSKRPSRNQDIQYIENLYAENQRLIHVIAQIKGKLQNSYKTIQLYDSILNQYKQNFNIQIQSKQIDNNNNNNKSKQSSIQPKKLKTQPILHSQNYTPTLYHKTTQIISQNSSLEKKTTTQYKPSRNIYSYYKPNLKNFVNQDIIYNQLKNNGFLNSKPKISSQKSNKQKRYVSQRRNRKLKTSIDEDRVQV